MKARQKVPFDLRGLTPTQFATTFRIGISTVSTWKAAGEMPYWASIVPIGTNPDVEELEAEVARLNTVIDELIKRVAR